MIQIYTDGACAGNPGGRGGWAAVTVDEKSRREISGGNPQTTSNRMEITAALEGLRLTPKGAQVTLTSDSQYLVYSMSAPPGKSKPWQRKANLDLWQQLDELVLERKVQWQWLPEQTHTDQQKAHQLANKMAGMPSEEPAPAPTHFDLEGKVHMVDIGEKTDTARECQAKGRVKMQPATLELVKRGGMAKGDVLALAQTAGIMGAKLTPHLIPLCHPLLLTNVKVEFSFNQEESTIEIAATVTTTGKTGVEMEALTAVAVSALTIYDMCKGVDKTLRLEDIRLVRKSGGKSGTLELE